MGPPPEPAFSTAEESIQSFQQANFDVPLMRKWHWLLHLPDILQRLQKTAAFEIHLLNQVLATEITTLKQLQFLNQFVECSASEAMVASIARLARGGAIHANDVVVFHQEDGRWDMGQVLFHLELGGDKATHVQRWRPTETQKTKQFAKCPITNEQGFVSMDSLLYPLVYSKTTESEATVLLPYQLYHRIPSTRRHATTPWKGDRVVLVAYTVNTLGKQLEDEYQRRTQSEHALLACQPDTETQIEEEVGPTEDSLPEQPVLWELWAPDPQTGEQLCVLRSDRSDTSEARAICKSEPVYTTNVELLAWLLVATTPQARVPKSTLQVLLQSSKEVIAALATAILAYTETQAVGTETLAQQDLQLSAFAVLLAFFQVVSAASQTTEEEEDLSLPVSLDADMMLAVSIICIGICFIAVWVFFKWCLQGVISRR
ncbi:unnamed protein product [Symbiodinium sp. CCMP2592]|nr:unnamed protein product [Symbiodinium sp. CCMP2592]